MLEAVLVPGKKTLHAVFNLNFVCPSERMKFADIGEFAHGAIGLRVVKINSASKSYGFYDKFGELANGEFFACADIDVTVAYFSQRGDCAATTF